MKIKKKLFESFIGNFIALFINLIFPLIVTKIYGAETLGVYTYNLSLITIVLCFAILGLNSGIMYFVPRNGKKYVLSSFVLAGSFSTIISLIWICITKNSSLKLMLPLLIFMGIETLFFSLYRVNQQIKEYFFTNIVINNGIKILFAYIFSVLFEPSLNLLILATFIGSICSFVTYSIKQRKMFNGFNFNKEILKYSVPLSIGSVMMIIMMQIDKIMIGSIINKTSVALYSVPCSIANFPSIFLTVLNTIFPPIISKLYHEKKYIKLRDVYHKSIKYLITISITTVLGIIIFRNNLLNLYGSFYLQGAAVLVMVSIGQVVNASVGSVWYIVSMTGYPRLTLIGKSIALTVNIILNSILIPIYGINGAAFATMMSTSINNIIGFFFVRKILRTSINSLNK